MAAAAAVEGFECVGAVGGDGTISDIAAGLAGTRAILGIIPAGTGNDLSRALGIPRAPSAAAGLLLEGRPRPLDLWRANEHPFINAAGIGLDAEVAYQVNQGGWLRGMPAYVVALLRALRTYQPRSLRLQADGVMFAGAVMLVAVANGSCYGGGIPIAPGARPDDGLLEIIVVRAMSRLALARAFPRLLRGAHLSDPRVTAFRAAALRIEGDPALRVTLDGELGARLPLAISLSPAPLQVITAASPLATPSNPRV